jgi:hypothetical protein
MSETDPYYSGPTVEEAKVTPSPAPEPEEVVAEPVVAEAEYDVPEGSAATVLEWVDGDKDAAQAALDAELAGQKRTTLISKLKAIIEG